MLSTIRSFLAVKSPLEKEAATLWSEGQLTVNDLTPKLGIAWDTKYLPYFRQWAKDIRQTPYRVSYTNIDDAEFWENISQGFTEAHHFEYALYDAARRGNLSVFNALPKQYIQAYSQQYLELVHTKSTNEIVHPNTVAFMRDNGYWSQDDVHALASTYKFVNAQTSSIKYIDERGIYHNSFALDWCEKSLKNNNWSADEQGQFIGNFLMTIGGEFWTDGGREVLAPLLHPDVDVMMLAAICKLDYTQFGPPCVQESTSNIHSSVFQGSIHFSRNVWQNIGGTMYNTSAHLQTNGGHAGLNILMDFLPPNDPMALYRLGMKAKQQELSHEAVESYRLPQLS